MPQPFDVVLLDLNGTFMFEHDRLEAGQRFGDTYRGQGGSALSDAEVSAAVDELVAHMTRLYSRPECFDAYPSVRQCLESLPTTRSLGATEHEHLERVVAAHELGRIPEAHAALLRQMARTHRLGVVSNLWSRPGPWLEALERAGLRDVFEWLVFSSDAEVIKPSPRIFDPVLQAPGFELRRALMVGDSLARDVGAARAAGMASLWLSGHESPPEEAPAPDFVLPTLLDLPGSGVLG